MNITSCNNAFKTLTTPPHTQDQLTNDLIIHVSKMLA